jgi:PKD repeat protein
MNKYISALSLVLLSLVSYSQCSVEPWSLQKRIDKSTVVIEGRVISQTGVWDKQHHNIYTINEIEVYKSFKGGYTHETIKMLTVGGIVGLDMLKASPSLELQKGNIGVFILNSNVIEIPNETVLYRPTASIQSFINYDLNSVKAYDHEKTYVSMKYELYDELKTITGETYVNVKDFDAEARHKVIKAIAPPVITSFSATTLTAGSSTEITINGSNFGFARGNGKVGFKDANFGDGRYYYSPTGWSYNSWSNSQIKLVVPSRAGTGKIQVINQLGESGESSTDLTVDWSHLNVNYPLNASDTPFYELQHVNDNTAGGYTWEMTNQFAGKTDAVNSFLRSLEEWRCETQMNWSVGNNTSSNALADDDINIVRFTDFGDSKLGVCYSRYSGCFISGNTDMRWYVKETDIEFDSTYDWYYGTGSPASNQFDFESVATHELGHGHQLGHVRASAKVMHYSIANGQRKPDLVATDIACGNYIRGKSVAGGVCGKSAMIAIPNGSCALSPPSAGFTISDSIPCPSTSVVYTDNTIGDVVSYAWDFGDQALPPSATGKGPHSVTYSSATKSAVKLVVTNTFGIDSAEGSIRRVDNATSQFSEVIDGTKITFTNESTNGNSYLWTFGDGKTSIEENPVHNYSDRGDFNTSLVTTNECGDASSDKDFSLSFNVGVSKLENSKNIYPNPIKNGEVLTIKGKNFSNYELHSTEGQTVLVGELVNNSVKIDVLVPAVYILTLTEGGESVHYRLQVTN